MIKAVLTAAGIPHDEARYPDPPAVTYAVYFDNIEIDGPDDVSPGVPCLVHHDGTIELYEPAPDPAAEAALEAQFLAHGLAWVKQARYWLDKAQRYQVIYEISYTTKI